MPTPETATIEFCNLNGDAIAEAKLFPETGGTLYIASDSEIEEHGEARVQLTEGMAYEYLLDNDSYQIVEKPGLLSTSRVNRKAGRITPGVNVGKLLLSIKDQEEREVAWGAVEVRSIKVSYRQDYRQMLEDITERSVDLLHEFRSPAHMYLLPDPGRSPETLTQRFAFVKSLLTSRHFRDAIHRITAFPHLRCEPSEQICETRKGFKANRSVLRQIVRGSGRIPVPKAHPLYGKMPSIPKNVIVYRNKESIDTPENQFIKHALNTFLSFITEVSNKLKDIDRLTDSGIRTQAGNLEKMLTDILRKDFFHDVSPLKFFPLGSPVLQRKGGYREILQAWLKFDMAARLVWAGGDDVYSAGKRDVATLYEYWIFFKLLEITCDIFELNHPLSKELIEATQDGFGLKLKSGHILSVEGNYRRKNRALAVRFCYNRTFARKKAQSGNNHQIVGSWTEGMRPDYTLSLWPGEFSEKEAERQELIVHIHFDAKYRINKLKEIFGTLNDEKPSRSMAANLNREKSEQKTGKYKRADLLKMHTYRDAIRRTAGAYVIYPGDESKQWQGFHEILPGLGAFSVRPYTEDRDGSFALKRFIRDVADHVCACTTHREQNNFHRFRIYNNIIEEEPQLYAGAASKFPEKDLETGERHTPPAETHVLVGWCKDEAHLAWINSEGKYNFRMGSGAGSLRLKPEVAGAKYLLLHTHDSQAIEGLFRITSAGPRVFSSDQLLELKYPKKPKGEYYLIFDVECDPIFMGRTWDIKSIPERPKGRFSAWPFCTTMSRLLLQEKN